jgi:hypothetical protein
MIDTTATRAAKLVGEVFLPGASLVLDGDVRGGTLHFVGGVVGRMLLGPVGWLYAAADSYSQSNTGLHFHQHFVGRAKASDSRKPVRSEETAAVSGRKVVAGRAGKRGRARQRGARGETGAES